MCKLLSASNGLAITWEVKAEAMALRLHQVMKAYVVRNGSLSRWIAQCICKQGRPEDWQGRADLRTGWQVGLQCCWHPAVPS